MPHLLLFGPGYVATRLMDALLADGWMVTPVNRATFADEERVRAGCAAATHVLSSVPPEGDADPVLARYGALIAGAPARWVGYLSSTGVYGDARGAWVDESAPVGAGRRTARTAADLAWQAAHPEARVFRLPGIYGPGRSPLDRAAAGKAHRVDLAGQVFSRIHVDDIVGAVRASMGRGPAGVFNLADDLPAAQNAVVEEACALLGIAAPPLLPLEDAALSSQARAFYAENRRVANGRAKRLLGWRPAYPDYRAGLRALSATINPASTSAQPAAASADQR